MALETCGSCLSCLLIPLALWSIVVNVLLYFPNGKASHAASYQLPNYVWYFEGICFSGVLVSIDSMHLEWVVSAASAAAELCLQRGIGIALAQTLRAQKLAQTEKHLRVHQMKCSGCYFVSYQ